MEENILYIVLGIGVVAIALSFQRWGDFAYIAIKNWKATVFVLACLLGGGGTGYYLTFGAPEVNFGSFDSLIALAKSFSSPSDEDLASMVEDCKFFVQSRLEGRGAADNPKDWDRCAHTFGTSYWKHDISINGENGGRVLCRAYHAQTDYVSSEVETWCVTVFAEQ